MIKTILNRIECVLNWSRIGIVLMNVLARNMIVPKVTEINHSKANLSHTEWIIKKIQLVRFYFCLTWSCNP